MSKPKAVYTLDAIHARCTEEGECWLWQGYIQNGSPYVYHAGKLTAVRHLVMDLSERSIRLGAKYFAASCGNLTCVCPEHVAARTPREHAVKMGSNVQQLAPLRISKLQTAGRARAIAKLNVQQADSIRLDQRRHQVIALEHGISKSLVSHIKRGVAWRSVSANLNPWIGLMS